MSNIQDPYDTVTVTATLSGLSKTLSLDFNVILPESVEVEDGKTYNPDGLTYNPEGLYIYAGTMFHLHLLPDTVIFDGFALQEVLPGFSWTFPDGWTYTQEAQVITMAHNLNKSHFTDTITTVFPLLKDVLNNGDGFEGTSSELSGITYNYPGAGGWIPIPGIISNQVREFNADGSGQVTSDFGDPFAGPTMGPWDY